LSGQAFIIVTEEKNLKWTLGEKNFYSLPAFLVVKVNGILL